MNRVRAAERGRRCFGQSEISHLAFTHELRHGANRFLDGRFRIDAVLVIKIDQFNAEPLQAGFAAGAHIFRLAAHTAHVRVGTVAHDAELGGEKNLLPAIVNGLADKNFVVAVAIDVGGVQEIDAEIDGAVNRGDGFGVIPRAIKFRHAHAAKAHRRYERSDLPKLAELHAGTSVEAYVKMDEEHPRPDTCPY